ncbi:nitrilase [Moniliophthora roreri]|nr:nitrilase [Moniliophthora roreri]
MPVARLVGHESFPWQLSQYAKKAEASSVLEFKSIHNYTLASRILQNQSVPNRFRTSTLKKQSTDIGLDTEQLAEVSDESGLVGTLLRLLVVLEERKAESLNVPLMVLITSVFLLAIPFKRNKNEPGNNNTANFPNVQSTEFAEVSDESGRVDTLLRLLVVLEERKSLNVPLMILL